MAAQIKSGKRVEKGGLGFEDRRREGRRTVGYGELHL